MLAAGPRPEAALSSPALSSVYLPAAAPSDQAGLMSLKLPSPRSSSVNNEYTQEHYGAVFLLSESHVKSLAAYVTQVTADFVPPTNEQPKQLENGLHPHAQLTQTLA